MAGRKSSGGYDLESSLSHLLRRAQQFAYDQFVQQMGDGAITPRQFIVLFAVNEEEGLSQTDLVNRTGIDRSTLADMISRMIKNGLLARKRTAEDARANAVRLGEAGRLALAEAQPKMDAADARLLKMLPGGKRDGFLNLLRELIRVGEAAASGEPAPGKKAKAPKAPKAPKPPKPEKVAKADGKKKKKIKKAA